MGFASVDDASQVSPRAYASFFRRLYNATFLTRELSERALDILSKTDFADGLRAGVPADVVVAHKFGERGIYEDGRVVGVELHDCGIVYAPAGPYLICVMTGGSDEKTLEAIICEISARVWAGLGT
jgi:beta-lactamase class A